MKEIFFCLIYILILCVLSNPHGNGKDVGKFIQGIREQVYNDGNKIAPLYQEKK